MAAKRLLVVSDEMEIGGSQRQITLLLGGLDRARWQPELLFFRDRSFLIDELERLGIPIHHVPKRGRIDPGFVLRYAAFLRRGRYDVVHAFSLTAELWTVLTKPLVWRSFRFVSSVRGLYLTESRRFWRLKRFVVRRSDAVIANARACASETARRVGVASDRFDVVPNGVFIPSALPACERDAQRTRIGVPEGRAFGLFVGRLVKEKNLACLIRALGRLEPDARPWMAIAGNGPMHADLVAMAAAAGLQADLNFIGERRDVTDLMQTADFLVLPSSQEGMSNALLEAMAAGCPVIASAVGGNRELVADQHSGLLFPNDDDHALGVCLRLLVTDPTLRTKLSKQAWEHAQAQHAVERMVSATAAVYERCLQAPTGRGVRVGGTVHSAPARDPAQSADHG